MANQSSFLKEQIYWKEQLKNCSAISGFPADGGSKSKSKYQYTKRVCSKEFPPELVSKLCGMTKNSEYGIFMILVSGLKYLIHTYSGEKDILVAMPVFKQSTNSSLNDNILLLRTKLDNLQSLNFQNLFLQTKETITSADENQNMSLEWLINQLNLDSRLRTVILMDNIHNYGVVAGRNADMVFRFNKSDAAITFDIDYNAEIYQESTIDQIASHLIRFLSITLFQAALPISGIEIISEEEKQEILQVFNHTRQEYPSTSPVNRLFEQIADLYPDHPALQYEGEQWSYGFLNSKSNQIARYLNAKGISSAKPVGILMERSLEAVAAIIAVVKSGGVYVPIDPQYPEERVRFMIKDSGMELMITEQSLLNQYSAHVECITTGHLEIYEQSQENLETINQADDLLYIMYTSGSTGLPKGVLIEHKNVVRLVKQTNYVQFQPNDRFIQTSPFVFDASTLELWGSLLNGLTLYLVDKETILDTEKLEDLLTSEKITIMWLTSPLFTQHARNHPEMFAALRYLFIGGDVLSNIQVQMVRRQCPEVKLINGYGPTENTTFSTCFHIQEDYPDRIPIGSPIGNSVAYVMDEAGRLKPKGAIGELYVGGDGVARGYTNQAELNASNFIKDPYAEAGRLYKTGDLCRWLPGGILEYLGRKDQQVKIRGFRIEPSEIEHQLLKHSGIKQSRVIVRKDNQDERMLCAYLVCLNTLSTKEIIEFLAHDLPEYMLPTRFYQVDSIPLTTNGKVDVTSLIRDGLEFSDSVEFIEPEGSIEEKVAVFFKNTLNKGKLGVLDDFFTSGGHSLSAAVLLTKINKEFKIRISLREFFANSTVRDTAKLIVSADQPIFPEMLEAEEQEVYPTSPAQNRMFILNQFKQAGTHYNVPIVLSLTGHLDKERFSKAIRRLIERHESLRTSFEIANGQLVQRIHPYVQNDILFREMNEAVDLAPLHHFIQAFDLKQSSLIRVGIFSSSSSEHYMIMDIHHIITDGVSMKLLLNDLFALYREEELQPLRLQYKDYAVWQKKLHKDNWLKDQEGYWLQLFANEIPVLELPTDYPRPAVQSYEGYTIEHHLDVDMTRNLRALAHRTSSTLYMVLLAALNVMLANYTGNRNILIGSPTAGRGYEETRDIVGMFVNMVVMNNQPEVSLTFSKFLEQVKRNTLAAFDHQDFPFEELVDKLKIQRDTSRNPLFDVTFDLQTTEASEQKLWAEDLDIKTVNLGNAQSKFDLTIAAIETERGIRLIFDYCSALFKPESIKRTALHFSNILEQVIDNPDIVLGEINLVTAEEKKQILYQFNPPPQPYPKEKTLDQLFEEQVELTPEGIALIYKQERWSYHELNTRVNRLARVLQQHGVGKNMRVALMLKRSPEMISIMLAVLKTGGAYVPIDLDSPAGRIADLIEDSVPTIIILKHEKDVDKIPLSCRERIVIQDQLMKDMRNEAEHNIAINHTSDQLAFVMFTSGSTGRPKGNLTTHFNVSRTVKNTNYIHITPTDTMLQLSNYVFDGSIFDIYGALLNGAALVMIDKETILDMPKLSQIIQEEKISIFLITTALFNALVDSRIEALKNVKKILFGGERVSQFHVNKAFAYLGPNRIIHLYGPSEGTVYSTYYIVNEWNGTENIPIGVPVSNTCVYILDQQLRIVPVGVPGEVCIGGEGVVEGYLKRPDLTNERFIDNPYQKHSKLYRTGDLAKWRPDGNIEFISRIDNQVKLRGLRIELGEIEQWIKQYDSISDCVVVLKEEENEHKYLAAYYVSVQEIDLNNLKRFISGYLASYMLPAAFFRVTSIPLTANGKTDVKALPNLKAERTLLSTSFIKASSQTEQELIRIWERILVRDDIGVHDNYFDLGGNSLQVVKMHQEIEALHPDKVSIADIFSNTTIASLAQLIISKDKYQILRTELAGLSFPADYITNAKHQHGLETMNLQVQGHLYEGISQLGVQNKMDIHMIMLALYLYLLHEATDQPKIPIHLVLSSNGLVRESQPAVSGIHDLSQFSGLFTEIKQWVANQQEEEGERVQTILDTVLPEKQKHSIRLFYTNQEGYLGKVIPVYDLAIHFKEEDESLLLVCEFNTGKLKREKISQIMNNYLQLIKLSITNIR
ncbi:non-ribosomal peptide synthetase [Paenibacillus monticola]|nr:non-ribosomal peptide synthetase [Paenibacillus monticola]